MWDMLKLLKTTVTGGLIFLLPLAVLGYILGKLVTTAQKLAEPISDKLPVSSFAGVSATIIIAVAGLILISFLAGLLAKTRIAQQTMKELETHLLGRVPAYGLIKSLGSDIVSPEQEAERRVVLVRFDDCWQLAILIDAAIEENHTVVFVPDSPTPQSGSVMIVETSRVHETDIPLRKAMSTLAVRGMGLQDVLHGQFRSAVSRG
jgi:uncharacterized membrane protein